MSNQDHAYALWPGFMLAEYRIERVLGAGGFGITYYAWDTHLKKAVAIKEYLPNEFAVRYDETTVAPKSSSDAATYDWGLRRFLEEAQVLAGFDHPHINRVHRRLEAHGTAYMVLEYLPGETLSARLGRAGRLSPREAWRLFNELLSGLAEVHRLDYVHRDIKPANIMLGEDGRAVLLDFGAARQAVGQRTRSITSIITPGYAPLEQYDGKADDVGPWSDFYALGVVAYRCVTGLREGALLDAVARARLASRGEHEKDMRPAMALVDGEYDRRLLEAIDWCMRVDERERPQGVADLKKRLSDGGTPPGQARPEQGPQTASNSKPRRPAVWAAAGAAVALLLGLGVWLSAPRLADSPGKVFRDTLRSGGKGPEMVVLPTGRFRMGDLSGDGRSDEKPARTVTISRPIAMGKYEVTVGEFRRFVTATAYRTEAERNAGGRQGCVTFEPMGRNEFDYTPGRAWSNPEYDIDENQPVTCVSWNDARRYIDWLNKETRGSYRLPSEAEWEYAARAGSSSRYHFGDDESQLCRYGNVADSTPLPDGKVLSDWVPWITPDGGAADCSDGAVYPTAVGRYVANPFGLHDMHGNVWEWGEDCWHDDYEGAPLDGGAWTSGGDCAQRVLRGGAWDSLLWSLRSARRWSRASSDRFGTIGFRLVRDLAPFTPGPSAKVEHPGSLMLTLEPRDARVTLPDIESRYRPGMALPAGEYRVVARREGYEEFEDTLRIVAGQRTTRRITLRRTGAAAAEPQDAEAQYKLGVKYAKGRGVPRDDEAAVKWFRLAAEQGYAAAQTYLGWMYEKGRGVPRDAEAAVKWYRLAAEQGYAAAQTYLGWMYENGRGVPRDDEAAVKWYRLAAEQGYARAQTNLGWMYRNGRGVMRDDEAAVKWYRLAAEQGHARAQNNLGVMYREGEGVPQDDEAAVKWYRLAAEQGHANAQTNLGWMYQNGRGVPRDNEAAVKWYRLAAEQGDATAQYNLGVMYRYGRGVPRDDEAAVNWYRLAAEQGNATAQNNLGVMYEKGRGVPRDAEAAVKWFKLAAEQGDAAAQRNLERLTRTR